MHNGQNDMPVYLVVLYQARNDMHISSELPAETVTSPSMGWNEPVPKQPLLRSAALAQAERLGRHGVDGHAVVRQQLFGVIAVGEAGVHAEAANAGAERTQIARDLLAPAALEHAVLDGPDQVVRVRQALQAGMVEPGDETRVHERRALAAAALDLVGDLRAEVEEVSQRKHGDLRA